MNGNVTPFARGGVVKSPTLFPMAKGLGLMGEAGPEAVMPLTRTAGGKLGVKAEGSGDVVVNLYEDAERAGQTEREKGPNEDEIISIFVANILSDGQAASALQGKYGLRTVGR